MRSQRHLPALLRLLSAGRQLLAAGARRTPALGAADRLLARDAVHLLNLLPLLLLRIPLPSLQHQHADQYQRQDRVRRREHLERILARHEIALAADDAAGRAARRGGRHAHALVRERAGRLGVHAVGDSAHAAGDVGDVDGDAAHVEDEGGAVEEHVGLGGAVELREQADEAEGDDEVHDARDQRRRGGEEAQVQLEAREVGRQRGGCGGQGGGRGGGEREGVAGRGGDRRARPQDVVVVGEGCEEDAEEEAGCWEGGCWVRLVECGLVGMGGCCIRPMMRKVANGAPLAMMKLGELQELQLDWGM
ncbi:hypothetical protein FH972_021270 [Carpinus fangiana]|uniref:Uncharacterized protein n=1 Tax=Carpinus fangiana TaxID=176857 RepID=A0A5N6KP91_9ROSI|nr:hypothetical protein FH972_021270 [Carpinus fangiana]